MKTIKSFMVLLAVFFTAVIATAQSVQYASNAPGSVPSNTGRETSLAVPKASGPNFFITAGATWMNAKDTKYDNSVDLYGATVSFGWRINKHNKIQMEGSIIGGSKGDSWHNYYAPNDGCDYNQNINYIAGMDIFTYSFCIPFDKTGVCELRLSPSIGTAYIFTRFKSDYNEYYLGSRIHYYSSRMDDGDFAFAAGGGIGLTFHTSKRFQLDLGYRYLRVSATSYNWGEMGALNANSLTFSAGWKF